MLLIWFVVAGLGIGLGVFFLFIQPIVDKLNYLEKISGNLMNISGNLMEISGQLGSIDMELDDIKRKL